MPIHRATAPWTGHPCVSVPDVSMPGHARTQTDPRVVDVLLTELGVTNRVHAQ